MKQIHLGAMALAMMLMSGCIKDEIKHSYTFYRPVYKTKEAVRQNIKSVAPVGISQPGKIFYKDGFIFLNEKEKGVHVIDIRNPGNPQVVSYINIPGCTDLAVRGNTLYADLSTDLVAINISDPKNVKVTQVLGGVFPHRYYSSYFQNDTSQVIVDWVRVDTVVWNSQPPAWGLMMEDMASFTTNSSKASNGTGGSMARFALHEDRLYTVSFSDLKLFNTSTPSKPEFIKQVNLQSGDIETIFPYKKHLFLGGQTGMYIFDIQQKDNPMKQGKFAHALVCDPVVATDKYAYVTLRNGTACAAGGFTNQLEIVNIENLNSPQLIFTYSLTNPHGLAADGTTLLICDGADGLRILDVAQPTNPKQIGHVKGFSAYDVIALGNIAIITAEKGLYFIDYSNPSSPFITSSINIGK